MRRNSLFWAVILILVGALLMLNNMGIIQINVWGLIWPLALISIGVSILWGVFFGGRSSEMVEAAIPLQGAAQAHIHIKHGAGRLCVDSNAGLDELLAGTFKGGMERRVKLDGDTLNVELYMPPTAFPPIVFLGSGSTVDWTFGLNGDIPITLKFDTGAAEAQLDLSDLRVTDLKVQTGASSTNLTMPANAGHTRAKIDSGAASVNVRVPSGVAARIRTGGGLTSVNVDRERFPREGSVYQSPDYDTAENKLDLKITTGVGSINVH